MSLEFNYEPDGSTIVNFMQSDAFVRGLQGPIGSGKSVACTVECLRLMLTQERSIDLKTGKRTGKRRVKIGVVRNTTPQLETTTMATWLEWLPENQFGKVRWRPPYKQLIDIPEVDLEAEVWFLALDREEDVRKLLSFEFTFIWLNEARELLRSVVTAAISRVDRFPRRIDGGATRPCIIMDTNAPDEEHWWAIMSGQAEVPDWVNEEDRLTLLKPKNWEFFVQPPGVIDLIGPDGTLQGYELNPDRENAKYTSMDYYTRLMEGQTRDWIRNMLQNQIGRIFAGRPVYRDFNERIHVAENSIEFDKGAKLHIGIDFGLTPAACFSQSVRGQMRTIDELVTRDMPATKFAPLLRQHIAENYPDADVVFTGDPRGDDRNDKDATTNYQVFAEHGMKVKAAWSNEPTIRIGAVQTQINSLVDGGRPGYLVSPNCQYVINAKKGGYCYKKDAEEIDKKSIFSHISDAEQYAALGMGLGHKIVGRGQGGKSIQANHKQDIFSRNGMTAKQRRQASILSRGLR